MHTLMGSLQKRFECVDHQQFLVIIAPLYSSNVSLVILSRRLLELFILDHLNPVAIRIYRHMHVSKLSKAHALPDQWKRDTDQE
jgi:hypothetical protein